MRTMIMFAAIGFLGLATQTSEASGQSRPDFSGAWTLSESSGDATGRAMTRGSGSGGAITRGGGGGGVMMIRGGLGSEVEIMHDDQTLTMARVGPQGGEMRSVYHLDGSESRNSVVTMGGAVEVVSTATWQESTLVIVSSGLGGGESTMTLSLDDSGMLIVETTRTGGPGGGGTTRAVYTRG